MQEAAGKDLVPLAARAKDGKTVTSELVGEQLARRLMLMAGAMVVTVALRCG
jgi:hypothetical protein